MVTIDLTTNTAYLFEDGALVKSSPAASGSEKVLRRGSRMWYFRTPRGRHTVVRKVVNPVWTKPDWAFIEEGLPIPPANSPTRKVRGKLGRYALDLGGGIMVHGTDDPKSIGQRVSHGCIRLPNDMLATIFKKMDVGSEVYIFESNPAPLAPEVLNALSLRAPGPSGRAAASK